MGKIWEKIISVFNLMYLVEIFAEFYPEEFVVKRRKKGRIPEYSVKELLTFYIMG